jgi:hypothetical protein
VITSHGVPAVDFAQVAGRLQRNWRPHQMNPHQALFGHSGAGKSHLVRYGILPQAGPVAPAVVIDVTAGGDRIWNGWGNDVADVGELPCPLRLGPNGRPHYRIVRPGGLTRADVARVLEQLAIEAEAILVMDDASSITENQGIRGGMGLGGLVDKMLREGRSNALTVILGLNSVAWAGSGAKFLPGAVWIGYTQSKAMRDDFANVAGLPKAARGALELPHLPPKRWLYSTVDESEGLHVLALTTPPGAST